MGDASKVTMTAQPARPNIPERIGRYRVVRPLSKGGMALVYEGRRESIGGISTPVAIKVILPDYARSETFRELFINEARLGAAMRHQNLVQIQDFGRDGEHYFLVMEYVRGLTLSRIIGVAARCDIPIPLGVICEIGRQACEGLMFAHQASDPDGKPLGLIHRDIKPSNLILDNSGGLKILDFGISKGALRPERQGQVKGTWGYMSPEQTRGESIAASSDLFSLGIVLFEMASRRSLFKGIKEPEIRRMLAEDYPARMVDTLDPHYAPLVKVLRKALASDPSTRFRTARQMGQALAELLPDHITATKDLQRFYQAVTEQRERLKKGQGLPTTSAGAMPRRGAQAPLQVQRKRRGIPWYSIITTLMLLVLIGAMGTTIWQQMRQAPEEKEVEMVSQDTPAVAIEAPAAPVDVEPSEPVEIEPEVVEELEPPKPVRTKPVVARAKPVAPKPRPVPRPVPEEAPQDVPDQGWLTVYAVQDAEVFIDGSLVRPPLTEAKAYKPGRHIVSIVTEDGRRTSFSVDLKPGEKEVKVFDFDRGMFR